MGTIRNKDDAMIDQIPPLAILLKQGPAMFAFDFGRYLG